MREANWISARASTVHLPLRGHCLHDRCRILKRILSRRPSCNEKAREPNREETGEKALGLQRDEGGIALHLPPPFRKKGSGGHSLLPPPKQQRPRIPQISITTTPSKNGTLPPHPQTPFSDKSPWESHGRARQRQSASEGARATGIANRRSAREPAVLLGGGREEGGKRRGRNLLPPHSFRTGGGSGPTHAVFFVLRWDPHAAPPAAGAAPEAGSPLPEWSS